MNLKLSAEVNEIINFSKDAARKLGNINVSPDHFFLGILRHRNNAAFQVMTDLQVDMDGCRTLIEQQLYAIEAGQMQSGDLYPTKPAEKVLKKMYLEARSMQEVEPKALHMLLSILDEGSSLLAKQMADAGMDYVFVKTHVTGKQMEVHDSTDFDDDYEAEEPETQPNRPTGKNAGTSAIDNFSSDLTKAAADNKLDPIVGREKEIERLAQILCRRKKNNPVLIGESGVGKTTIVEGLAIKIVNKQTPRILWNKRLVALDLAGIVAGTKYRGQFEERIKAILNDLQKNPDIILFIDELHTLVGAGGSSGSLDAANMLKPALARGELQCIGTTTLDEYREHIEKDGALERRFQKIIVHPPTPEETLDILNNIKDKYEDYHFAIYTPEAIKACVALTERYVSDRMFPDKAIDAMDEAGSRVHLANISIPDHIRQLESKIADIRRNKQKAADLQNYEKAADLRNAEVVLLQDLEKAQKEWEQEIEQNRQIVDEDKVAEVVAMMTNVPVQRMAKNESERLLKMPEALKGKIIGQDEAVGKVTKAIQRNRAGLKDPMRPIGSFIFLGPTGVGKTQLAKALNQYMFESNDSMIRIDMSEYMEKFAVSRLIGAPPGYVGYEEGGQLTEKVRRRPYSVILFDEIEKAHPDVFNILLQLLDEGQLTDGLGRKIDFKNTIIIMTSNVGSREVKEFSQGIGFVSAMNRNDAIRNNTSGIIDKALKRHFAPEFLNRIDDIIIFNSLQMDDIFKIVDIELAALLKRLSATGYSITISNEAKNFVARQGYDPQYGARPLKRSIQKHVEDSLAEAILRDNAAAGDAFVLDVDGEGKTITVKTIKAPSVNVENAAVEQISLQK
ncbi:MAG: ATP-dependent Clp protease ATP-binding subunit [Prevotellaceae bacterium]|jgi:ATP-dependent Clp protease ATP-binding subunit ClpC|nr:ATP-dependent Clp protease ATP-binding subunit [Prevotellaceae bacterium]